MTIVSPLHAIDASTFLKSYRCEISFAAWLSALSTSCRSTLLTTSKDDSLATVHPSGVPVPDGTSARPPAGACYPCTRRRRSRRRGGLPEWPKGAVCKTVGIAYVGSNPSPATPPRGAPDQQRHRSGAVAIHPAASRPDPCRPLVTAYAAEAAEQLEMALRLAFWRDSRTISMRQEISDVARSCDAVHVDRLREALDDGRARGTMMR